MGSHWWAQLGNHCNSVLRPKQKYDASRCVTNARVDTRAFAICKGKRGKLHVSFYSKAIDPLLVNDNCEVHVFRRPTRMAATTRKEALTSCWLHSGTSCCFSSMLACVSAISARRAAASSKSAVIGEKETMQSAMRRNEQLLPCAFINRFAELLQEPLLRRATIPLWHELHSDYGDKLRHDIALLHRGSVQQFAAQPTNSLWYTEMMATSR